MDKITNEQLCIAAQSGDKWAENALVENNLRFIRKTTVMVIKLIRCIVAIV